MQLSKHFIALGVKKVADLLSGSDKMTHKRSRESLETRQELTMKVYWMSTSPAVRNA
jgi:hypothetical protein